MKNKLAIAVFILLSVFINSCKDKVTSIRTFKANVPVYMTYEEFSNAVTKTSQQDIENPGKIYIKDNYLYLNDVNKGIHVYDNSNPASPQYVCFINIPGNVDIAIKGDNLYVDSYIDLVSLDISDPHNPTVIDRVHNAFPNIYPGADMSYPLADVDESQGIVIGWKTETITTTEEDYYRYYNKFYRDVAEVNTLDGGGDAPQGGGNTGTAGSMARFALKGNALYCINNGYQLKIFDIGTHEIKKTDSIDALWNIETLFVYNDNLFIGSNNGMYIYDVSETKHPVLISQYSHVTSCDPVIVNDTHAFITLRTGNSCFGNVNELHIVSLENLEQPELLISYEMYNPHGLGLDDNILFICDGDQGLKIYNAADVMNIELIKHFENIQAFDVIPFNNILIMTGENGIVQYDYSDINNIVEISRINVGG